VRDAIRRGSDLGDARERIVTASLALQSGPAADESLAEAATAAAEDSRLREAPDPGAWQAALARWRGQARPYLIAYVRYREGEASLELGDRAAAADALSEAHAIASDLGARPLRDAIDSLAVRARIHLELSTAIPPAKVVAPIDPPAARPAADPFGLTQREREVLELLTLGRTNRQIGQELFISGNTAGVHVSNILGKLGASSRAEAAGIAVRLGLVVER
jgi:DNA-binding CsgD family transcriptional regulator